MSSGIINAKRTLPGFQVEVFQITAPISQGSSGGALLNSKGQAVGVPFVQMVSGQNLNFAIPITYVSPLIVNAPAKPFPNIPRATTARAARLKQPSSPSTDQPPAQPALSSRPGAGDVQQILKVPLAIKLDLSDLTSDDNAAPKSELDSVQALYDQKKYDEAKASFNTVSDNTKTTFDGQLLLCKIEQQRKEYREAVSACETAIKARPSAVTPTELKRLLC